MSNVYGTTQQQHTSIRMNVKINYVPIYRPQPHPPMTESRTLYCAQRFSRNVVHNTVYCCESVRQDICCMGTACSTILSFLEVHAYAEKFYLDSLTQHTTTGSFPLLISCSKILTCMQICKRLFSFVIFKVPLLPCKESSGWSLH